jgi:hypothetical protein
MHLLVHLLQVLEILDDTRLLGRCLNSHKLGQRKNCNLPGVLVDLPVLGPKDVEDVQGFAAKHGMDYIFASFVQSADDVRYIRKVRVGLVSALLDSAVLVSCKLTVHRRDRELCLLFGHPSLSFTALSTQHLNFVCGSNLVGLSCASFLQAASA